MSKVRITLVKFTNATIGVDGASVGDGADTVTHDADTADVLAQWMCFLAVKSMDGDVETA